MPNQKTSAKHITQRLVLSAKARPKPYELRDSTQYGLMVRVQPTGKKTWVCQFTTNGKKSRKTIGDATAMLPEVARNKARTIISGAAEGINPTQLERKRKSQTLRAYISNYYKEHAAKNIAASQGMLNRLERHFSHVLDVPMTDITIKDIEHWRCEREKTSITFSTLKREFTSFKALMNTAKKTHLVISSHQLESYTLKPPTDIQESRDVRYLTESEEFRLRKALDEREKALIAARDSGNQWREARGYETLSPLAINGFADHLKPIVLLALNTGLRRGDLFTLEWEHINFEHRHIRKLINKTKKRQKHPKPAILPLSTEALDILSRWKPKTGATGYVFKSPVTGLPFDNINKAWRQIVTNAKIESFRFHDLRHTFASRLVMAGVPLNTVRELMTHSKPEMTLIYSHLSPDHKASAIEKVFG